MSKRNFVCSLAAALFAFVGAVASAAEYKGPIEMIPTKDGSTLYVLNKDAREIAVVSVADAKVERSIPVPGDPNDMCLSADEKTVYLGLGDYQGKICALNLADGAVLGEGVVGHTPCGLCLSPDEKTMYACLRFEAKLAKISLPSFAVEATYPALHEPCDAVITPDGKTYFAANFLPNDPSDGANVAAEVTALDTATGETKNIRLPNGSSSMHDVCISPDGKYVYTTAILARYQLPTTQVERGWMNTNGFSIIDAEKREFINTVLLDDVDSGASNPWPIATTADGAKVCVGLAGSHELCVVDWTKTLEKLQSLPKDADEAKEKGLPSNATTADQVPQHLAFLVGLKKRVKLNTRQLKAKAPRCLAVIGDKAYLGMYFTDNIVVVNMKARNMRPKEFVKLGPEPEMDAARRGELAWNDATLCFQTWQSCASCHPDARSDALNWDLLNDGMGNPKNAKGMLHSILLPPAMWHGVRDKAETAIRTGFKFICFSNPPEETYTDIEEYIKSLKALPSPRLVDGKLSEKALRGKALFESERLNCAECHTGEYFTDQKMHDVGSRAEYDHKAEFDTPTLLEVWRTPPYMHDGRYVDLRDVFLDGMHGDVKGDVGSLTEEEVDDLTEYLLSL
ncbi:MAG: c-type cytochrome [Thermoguttaceae bacterium]|nr:c-type cytochrome [Thermoguttaceae bacterium]